MASRSEHTTNRNTGTKAHASSRARADEKRRPAPTASTTRRRGAEKAEASAKPKKAVKPAAPKAAATPAKAEKPAAKAPAKKRMPKNAAIDRPELEAERAAAAAAHAQADDVTTDSLQLFFNAARKYPLLTASLSGAILWGVRSLTAFMFCIFVHIWCTCPCGGLTSISVVIK
jgi:predicted Zn-dependent protease